VLPWFQQFESSPTRNQALDIWTVTVAPATLVTVVSGTLSGSNFTRRQRGSRWARTVEQLNCLQFILYFLCHSAECCTPPETLVHALTHHCQWEVTVWFIQLPQASCSVKPASQQDPSQHVALQANGPVQVPASVPGPGQGKSWFQQLWLFDWETMHFVVGGVSQVMVFGGRF
jgi:hypothetical protein